MNWLGNLAGFLPGAQDLSEQDRMALIRQGLLAAGSGILANNQGNYGKAGPAIGAGLSQGLLAMNKGAGDLSDRKRQAQLLALQAGDPAEFRAMDLAARAAGYEPGSQGYKDFFRRDNGELARQSSAAYGYQTVTGPDGKPRLVVTDPRNPTAAPLSADGLPAGGPSPRQDFLGLADQYGAQISSMFRTPEHNKAVGGVPNSQHMEGTAGDFVVPAQVKPQFIADAKSRGYQVIDEGDHVHLELPPSFKPAPVIARPSSTAGMNPFEGQTPAQKAYGEEVGKRQAGLDLSRQQGLIDAQNAGDAAAQGQFGKDAAGRFETIQQRALSAQTENNRLIELRQRLGNAYTGPGANAVLGAKRWASAMGMDVEGLGDAEAARALSNQLALGLRNPAGGEGMPGAMSDADREFLRQSVPGLSNTPAGWRALLDMKIALNDAAIKQAQYAEQLRRSGTPVQDIPGMLQNFANQNTIFHAKQPAAAGWSIEAAH